MASDIIDMKKQLIAEKKFFFYNKSCYRRQPEICKVEKFLLLNGYKKVSNLTDADLIIFFTCAFSRTAVNEMLSCLDEIYSSMKKNAELIVGSCLPKIDKESLSKIFCGKTISPRDFSILNELPDIKIRFEKIQADHDIETGHNRPVGFKKNAAHLLSLTRKAIISGKINGRIFALKNVLIVLRDNILGNNPGKRKIIIISKGCLRKCSYCAIRFATGSLISMPLDDVMQQFHEGLKSGFRLFDIYSDSMGDYGFDIGINLGILFEKFIIENKKFSMGIYDLPPDSLLKYFEKIEILCKQGKIYHLYVPTQSGNPRILDLMNRHCPTEELKQKLVYLKKYKKVFLQTSIIIGFPTETDKEFQDTLNLLREVNFDNVLVHFYTDMPNTESSKMPGKIKKDAMSARLKKIIDAKIKHNMADTIKQWENVPF